MKPNYFKLFAGIPLILCCLFLSSCKIMKPSDYKKAKEVVSSELAKVGLHGDVTINKLDWTALEIPTYHVYDRKTMSGGQGYLMYSNASSSISAVGNIFPVVLYLVAAMVTFTTMTRFVDEERTNAGVF